MESVQLAPSQSARETVRRLEKEAGTEVTLCYQCGKCAAGCPVAFAMDYTPRQVLRLLQLGLVDTALHADSVWLCVTCETCSTRCPRGVDIASLMDAVRREALAQGIVTDRKVAAFNEVFLSHVRRYGRLHEVGLTLEFNLKTRQPLKDAGLGLPMFSRGKVHLLPEVIRGQKQVQEIFERVKRMRGEEA
ncbi:MAG: 4Fe-4S dicluster domain-containing protein [Syntrophomonadaceae bacterium]|jgi:heterodisulfide reductase subunit C|nr:4Fe-4S dicluster domain-containing protein [Syntrophomonadaceae bacterium]MDH7498429.1 4Fe-4S dicluster domain-containing protein [Syntrophomonadaceae bacterium]